MWAWRMHLAWAGYIYGRAGRKSEAEEARRRLQALSSQVDVSPQWMLLVATGLGANDEALIYLEEAFAKHSMGGAIPLKVNPIFDPLRSDPRYAGFLRRAHFVP